MKKLTLMSVLAVLCLQCLAQEQAIRPLSVGDTVPDIIINNIINYKTTSAKLSDFKDKLLILDFMTTGCISCIEKLPRYDSLIKQFHEDVVIFIVSAEPESRMKEFFDRKNMSHLSLPCITGDTILSTLFPHMYISHEAIIQGGVVKGITWPEYINARKIDSVLNGFDISFRLKKDILNFGFKEPLLHPNENVLCGLDSPSVLGYAGITSHISNVPQRITRHIDTAKKLLHISMVNFPILEMYARVLYGTGLSPSFIRLPATNKSRFVYSEQEMLYHDWLANNTFCYDGWFPTNVSDSELAEKIKNDLNFYLKLDGKMERKLSSCWVIRKIPSSSINTPPKPTKKQGDIEISIQSIVFGLNQEFGGTPVIDETGTPEFKIFGLPKDAQKNIKMINQHLKSYGLSIEPDSKMLDLLVITELNQKLQN